MATSPQVQGFFDEATNTVSYVASDTASNICAIVDSVLDYDPAAGRTGTQSADRLIDYLRQHGLKLDWILETHVHADHLSAAPYVKEVLGGRVGIGEKITIVASVPPTDHGKRVVHHDRRRQRSNAPGHVIGEAAGIGHEPRRQRHGLGVGGVERVLFEQIDELAAGALHRGPHALAREDVDCQATCSQPRDDGAQPVEVRRVGHAENYGCVGRHAAIIPEMSMEGYARIARLASLGQPFPTAIR
jgi:hypothetical protein